MSLVCDEEQSIFVGANGVRMRISNQLLRSRAKKPLHSLEYIDLSALEIERIERLSSCGKLRTLLLSGNKVDYISNLQACPQLWKIDLSNNCIKSLEGLSRFVALGTLVLSNNQITWSELAKMRHMHILDLCLHGNPQLEQDPYYRIHVVDCLPNVWMLDGRIITSAERLQVMHFFQDSALTDHPVRHKCGKDSFTPTQLKNIEVNGIFGEKTVHLMRRFPVNGALNIDTDRRRLKYLAYNIQEDLKLEAKYERGRDLRVVCESEAFLEDVLSIRQHDREKANMLLLLLVASLEFAIPIQLMKETLEATKLNVAVNVKTMNLFLLPRESRCSIVSLLLSGVKVDKDVGEEGGLYDKLYLCLYYSVAELIKLSQASDATLIKVDKKSQALYADSRSLIGAEVVQLLCIVPAFFDYVTKDPGIMHLVSTATSDSTIIERVRRLMYKLEKDVCDPQHICEEAADIILTSIQQNALNMINRSTSSPAPSTDVLLNLKKPLPRRPQSSPIFASEYHAAGRPTPRKPSAKDHRSGQVDISPQPCLGDQVLLGPQNIARIISKPEVDIVLVQMDVVPAETGAMVKNKRNPDDHYTYLDMRELYWDQSANYWRPKGTVGDRISITNVDQDEVLLSDRHGYQEMAPPELLDHMSQNQYSVSSTPQPPTTPSRTTTPGLSNNLDLLEEVPRAVSVQLKERLNLKLEFSRGASTNGQTTGQQTGVQQTIKSIPEKKSPENPKSLNAALEVTPLKPNITSQSKESTGSEKKSPEVPQEANIPIHIQQPADEKEVTPEGENNPLIPESAFISIDIPQVPHDMESQGDVSTRSVHTAQGHERSGMRSSRSNGKPTSSRSNARRSTSPPKDAGAAQSRFGVRPATADAGAYRIRVAKDSHYVSSYQAQRTEAWKNTKLTRPNSSMYVSRPRQQQNTSNPQPSSPASSIDDQNSRSKSVSVCRGNSWLAGGRDLHWESLLTRPRTAHAPGWKEGLSPRPKSGAAMRALKRNKSPAIVTPSSMAYDFAYGRAAHQTVPELIQTEYAPPAGNQSFRRFPLSCMVLPLPPRRTPIRRPSTAPLFYGYQQQLHRPNNAHCQCHSKVQKQHTGAVNQDLIMQQHQLQQDLCDPQLAEPMLITAPYLIPPNPGPSVNNSFVESGAGSDTEPNLEAEESFLQRKVHRPITVSIETFTSGENA